MGIFVKINELINSCYLFLINSWKIEGSCSVVYIDLNIIIY